MCVFFFIDKVVNGLVSKKLKNENKKGKIVVSVNENVRLLCVFCCFFFDVMIWKFNNCLI